MSHLKIDRLKIKLVDGFKIRNHLDIEFNNLHGHGTEVSSPQFKSYIPEGEWWLDHCYKSEMDFIIKVEEFYYEWPDHIETFTEFRQYEKEKLCLPPPIPDFVISREGREEHNIVMINGAIVRKYIDPEFVVGGHRFVYDYVPEGEIWVDSIMDPREVPYATIHEVTEYDLMAKGMSYESAHDYANAAERERRRVDGFAKYPFEPDYPWKSMSNEELAKQFYV